MLKLGFVLIVLPQEKSALAPHAYAISAAAYRYV